MDISQEPVCMEIYRKHPGQPGRGHRFMRTCAVQMHMDISPEPFCLEIYRETAKRYYRDTRFVRACAVEMHMDISQAQEPHFVWKFTSQTRQIPPRLITGPSPGVY